MNEPSAHKFDDELLSAYVDDELDARERAAVEERLRTDERARRLVDELRGASDAVKSLPRESLGRDLRASVLARIERETAPPAAAATIPPGRDVQGPSRRGGAWVALAIAAGLLMMVALPLSVREFRPLAEATSKKEAAVDQPLPTSEPALAVDREAVDSREQLASDAPAEPSLPPEMAPTPALEAAIASADSGALPPPPSAGEEKVMSRGGATSAAAPAPGARGGAEGQLADGRNDEQRRTFSAGVESTLRDEVAAAADKDAAADKPDDEELPVRVVAGDATARFEQILVELNVVLVEDQLPTGVAETLAEAVGDDDSAADAVLVEGTREQIDAVLAAIAAIAANRGAAAQLDAAAAVRLRSAAPPRGVVASPGVAWRFARRGQVEESEVGQPRADAFEADDAAEAAVTLQAAPSAAAAAPTARVRMLFLLQPEAAAAAEPSR